MIFEGEDDVKVLTPEEEGGSSLQGSEWPLPACSAGLQSKQIVFSASLHLEYHPGSHTHTESLLGQCLKLSLMFQKRVHVHQKEDLDPPYSASRAGAHYTGHG